MLAVHKASKPAVKLLSAFNARSYVLLVLSAAVVCVLLLLLLCHLQMVLSAVVWMPSAMA
jgi:hypothetical protein